MQRVFLASNHLSTCSGMLRRKSPTLVLDEDLVHELEPGENVGGDPVAEFRREIDALAERSRELLDAEFRRDPLAHWVLVERGPRGNVTPLESGLCEFAYGPAGEPSCRSSSGTCPNCRGVNDEAADRRLRVLCVGNVLRKVHLPPGAAN